nr:Scr1 family TA system antitoxin-like transcriptional regulator [Streptomyces sp. CB02923]
MHHLVEAAANPHFTLQVLRFKADFPASSSAFTLLMPDEGQLSCTRRPRNRGTYTTRWQR